jgi:dipeptidyl aminopeptidase/acylaminoacyl peptidase
MRSRSFAIAFVAFALAGSAQTKRAFQYSDTNEWRSISGQKLSPDGKFLGYGLFPQEGNGEVILRNIGAKSDLREPAGARPAPPPPDPDREGPPIQRTTTLNFSADSRWAAFTTFPTKEEVQADAKKKEAERAKGDLVVVELASGAKQRYKNVKNYQMPGEGAGLIVFLEDNAEKRLTLMKLGGEQKNIPGVTEYLVAKDAATVVYATAEGVYAVNVAAWDTPRELVAGKAKYTKLAWDEKQSQLAFTSEKTVYVWDRKPNPARALALDFTPAERGSLSFSKDGARLFLPIAARTAARPARSAEGREEQPTYDLWHYKDDVVQTIQRARAATERGRTYRVMVSLADGKARQLTDQTLPEISISETGAYGIGSDDRAYRGMVEYDTRYSDHYLVNTSTGERRLLGKKRGGGYSWSPDGRYATRFDSKNWHCLNVATGVETNLTNGLNLAFHNEDYDMLGEPNPYGPANWTSDGKWVLIPDRFDLWQISPDGRVAKNLTDGVGRRQQIQFRVQRPGAEERAEGLDATKPLLLRGENLATRASGIYSDLVDGSSEPRALSVDGKSFSAPVKAKNAEVYMLTASTFREYPDILITNAEMKSFEKVTQANPQLSTYYWGTGELLNFRSNEGQNLQAAVYKPEGFDPSKKYPLMVYIYERLSQGVNNFSDPRPSNSINIPLYVSNGYIVMTPDIAYKPGYPGESAMNCVLPAVQKLIDQGFVDPARIGIQGHSWGGYQIAYMVTRTKLFKAAAPGAVVGNMFSAYNGIRYGTGLPRQFQYERTQSRIGGTPWQYPLRFLENSPVFRADQIETPLLMMHNDADDAVPFTQGIELFLAMRRLGKEVYMFNYNGEPHNLRKRPNQMHYATKLKEFFDHHLMGAPKPEWMEKGRPYLEKEPFSRRPEVSDGAAGQP